MGLAVDDEPRPRGLRVERPDAASGVAVGRLAGGARHRPRAGRARVPTRESSATTRPLPCAGCTCWRRSPRFTSPRSRRRCRCAATASRHSLDSQHGRSPAPRPVIGVAGHGAATAEWQYAATRSRPRPGQGPARRLGDHDRRRRHRRRRHARRTSPRSRRSPTTPSRATDTVSDATGHGTFVASLAAGSVATGARFGLRRRRPADDRAGEPRRERLHRRRRGRGRSSGRSTTARGSST